MTRRKILVGLSLGLVLFFGWLGFSGTRPEDKSKEQPSKRELASKKSEKEDEFLNEIRQAARERLPRYQFKGEPEVVLSELEPEITELEVYELILAIEGKTSADLSTNSLRHALKLGNADELRANISFLTLADSVRSQLRSQEGF